MKHYNATIGGENYNLPIVHVSQHQSIAYLSSADYTDKIEKWANLLNQKAEEYDVLIVPEAKGIPIAYEMAKQKGVSYVIATKTQKVYQNEPISISYESITTKQKQTLWLDAALIPQGSRCLIVDDVKSTGQTLDAVKELIVKAGGKYIGSKYICIEGTEDQDIERNYSLGYLPLLKRHRPGFVIAMNEEFTSDLKELLAPFSTQIIISGIGTTNAALAAQRLVLKEKCNIIINVGIVGALDKNLKQGDLCAPCNTMYHDADNNLILMGKEELFSLDTSWNNNRKFKEVKTIVSGNTFIDKREKADLLMNNHGAAIVDMESAALAHTCSMLDTPLVIMKVVSDYCDAPVFQLNTGYMDGIAPHLADYLKTLNT